MAGLTPCAYSSALTNETKAAMAIEVKVKIFMFDGCLGKDGEFWLVFDGVLNGVSFGDCTLRG